jgi:hypothetical protein
MRFWKIGLVVLLLGILVIGCTQMSAEESFHRFSYYKEEKILYRGLYS